MSTIAATTLEERASSDTIPVATVVAGAAKVWVNFNGTGTVAIRDSFNVSSITDNATGDYTINFTTNLPNANYGTTVGGKESDTSSGQGSFSTVYATGVTVSGCNVITANVSQTKADFVLVNAAIFCNP